MSQGDQKNTEATAPSAEPFQGEDTQADPSRKQEKGAPQEIGGPKGPEPTRYGDWEVKGRCSDF